MNQTRTAALIIIIIIILGLVIAAFTLGSREDNGGMDKEKSVTPTTTMTKEEEKTFSPSPRSTMQIKINSSGFDPDKVKIKVNDSVRWSNESSQVHTVTSNDFRSGEILSGQSFTKIFTSPGKFLYHCSVHSEEEGEITVQ